MKIDWLQFIPALLLLFYPLDHALRGRVRLRAYEDVRNDRPDAADAWWRQPWTWVDPIRACVGGWLLRTAWTIEPPVDGFWLHLPLMGTLVVLALALGVQMHTRRVDSVLLAPMGYSAGLVFALLPPQVAVLVVVLAFVCLMAFRGWWAFFFFGAAGAGAFGYLILRVNLWMAGTVVLMMMPLMLGMLVRRELLLPSARVQTRSRGGRSTRGRGKRKRSAEAPLQAVG
jgi:hypothetical protein